MEKLYCTNCGKKQKINTKKCEYCHKKILTKQHPIKDFLYEYIDDAFQGKVKDTFFSILTYYIKSHLYGFVLTITIMGSIAAGIVSNVLTSPNITNEKPKLIETVNYTNSEELLTNFITALANGEEQTIKSMMYETYYPEKYKEYYSDKEPYITNKIDGSEAPSYDIRQYATELKNGKDKYFSEFHNHYLTTAEQAKEIGSFESRYFVETKKMAYDNKDVVEGSISINYCLTSECKDEFDFNLFTFYLMIKEENNWYIYKTLSDDEKFISFKENKGNINQIVKGSK